MRVSISQVDLSHPAKTGFDSVTSASSKICGYDCPHESEFAVYSKIFLSADRIREFPKTATEFAGYVWTKSVFGKRNADTNISG